MFHSKPGKNIFLQNVYSVKNYFSAFTSSAFPPVLVLYVKLLPSLAIILNVSSSTYFVEPLFVWNFMF